jgi:hypothetical protein
LPSVSPAVIRIKVTFSLCGNIKTQTIDKRTHGTIRCDCKGISYFYIFLGGFMKPTIFLTILVLTLGGTNVYGAQEHQLRKDIAREEKAFFTLNEAFEKVKSDFEARLKLDGKNDLTIRINKKLTNEAGPLSIENLGTGEVIAKYRQNGGGNKREMFAYLTALKDENDYLEKMIAIYTKYLNEYSLERHKRNRHQSR